MCNTEKVTVYKGFRVFYAQNVTHVTLISLYTYFLRKQQILMISKNTILLLSQK